MSRWGSFENHLKQETLNVQFGFFGSSDGGSLQTKGACIFQQVIIPPMFFLSSFFIQEWEAQDKLHAQLETEVEKLEAEKQKLLTLMQAHRPSCIIRRKDACMMQEASITTASQHDDHKYDGR